MKFKESIICWIIIILSISVIFLCSVYGNQPILPDLKTPIEYERIKELYNYQNAIDIFCIDGYKWIITASGAKQFYIINNKGQVVPARCE